MERSKVAYQLNAVKEALPRGVGRQHCGRMVKDVLQAPRAQGTLCSGDCHAPQARPSPAVPILEGREYSGGTRDLRALENGRRHLPSLTFPVRVAGARHASCCRP